MSLTMGTYLKEEFRDDLLAQTYDPELTKKITEIGGKVLSSSSLKNTSSAISISDIQGDLISGYSTFGIGIGLALLGTFLAKKYRKSKAARIIAKIFGANVEQLDRSYVLQKLVNDQNYFEKVRRGITETLSKGDYNQLLKYFASEFDLREEDALEVYLQVKDVLLDSQVIGSIIQISVRITDIQNKILEKFDSVRNTIDLQIEGIRKNMDTRLEQQISEVNRVFLDSLTEYGLLQANFEMWSHSTEVGNGDKNCWKLGYFTEREIKSNYDVRRIITDEVLSSIEENFGTIIYGEPYHGKSLVLKRVMLEAIEKWGYIVVFCNRIVAKEVSIKYLLTNLIKRFPNILVIVDNAHSNGTEEVFKVYNYFLSKYNDSNGDSNTNNTVATIPIRFLFAARTEEIKQLTDFVQLDDRKEVEYAQIHIDGLVEIKFGRDESGQFVQKALETTSDENRSLKFISDPDTATNRIGNDIFDICRKDPLLFGCHLRSLVTEIGKKEGQIKVEKLVESIVFLNCVKEDFNEKKIYLDNCNDEDLRRAALICAVMGTFDIGLSREILRSCGVRLKHLRELARSHFLMQIKNVNKSIDQYQIRHPKWAIEFLAYLYNEVENDFVEFDSEYEIKELFTRVLAHISLQDLFNILKFCVTVFSDERVKPLSTAFIQNFEIPTSLRDLDALVLQEQLAFSLNRTEQSLKAEEILLQLIKEGRGRGETYGILGRVYKDRWKSALDSSNESMASEYFEKAVNTYLKGFQIDQSDYYPGINALTLMEIKNPTDERIIHILPLVRDAVEKRISSIKRSDYWDYATLLELAVLDKNESKIPTVLNQALTVLPENWQVESTLGNIKMLKEVREERNELVDIETKVINELENYQHENRKGCMVE